MPVISTFISLICRKRSAIVIPLMASRPKQIDKKIPSALAFPATCLFALGFSRVAISGSPARGTGSAAIGFRLDLPAAIARVRFPLSFPAFLKNFAIALSLFGAVFLSSRAELGIALISRSSLISLEFNFCVSAILGCRWRRHRRSLQMLAFRLSDCKPLMLAVFSTLRKPLRGLSEREYFDPN